MFTTSDLFGKFHSPRHSLHSARARLPRSPNELATLFNQLGLLRKPKCGPLISLGVL